MPFDRKRARAVGGAAVLAVVLCLLTAPPVHACGLWHLHEKGRARTTDFYIESVTRRGQGGLLRIVKHGSGVRATDRQGRVLRIEDGVLLRDDRPVGTVEDGVLTLGGRSWEIDVARRPEGAPGPDVYRWSLEVRRDGERVAHADRAMAFCQCGECEPEQERLDILRRTALYLAWRQLGY